MQLLLTILATLLAGTLVVLVPGAGLLAMMRVDRAVPPPLVPAAALAIGLVPLAAITGLVLLAERPIEWVAGGLALVVAWSWSTLAARIRREARLTRTRARAGGWLSPVRSLVAGEWLRGTPAVAIVAALVGGVLALLVGYHAWNDSLYHIGQAQKLLALDAPSLTNTLQFRDGSAHPGYLIPAWQEAIALTAWIARVDPVTAAWILPGLTIPVSLLAAGGLGWATMRARGAASVASVASLLVLLGMLPMADPIINAMHPGSIALGALAPLAIAMLLTALWPAAGDAPRTLEARTATRAATLVAMVATAGVGLLHVGYLWVLGMGILGYVLAWGLHAPHRRAVVVRHLRVGVAIALVAGACLALLLPGLTQLEGLGRDAAAELQANDSPQYEGENAANLDALLVGDPEGRFHLRADYLVLAGGLALLGLLVIPFTLLAPRWPGGWYLTGSATLVLGIALGDRVFPAFVRVVTLDQARRIERVLPLPLALAVGALGVGAAAAWVWRRGGMPARIAAITGTIAAMVGSVWMVDQVAPLAGYGGVRIVEPRVLVAVLVVLLAGAAAALVAMVVQLARRGPDDEPASAQRRLPLARWTWPTELIDRAAVGIALAVLLVGAVPLYANADDAVDSSRLTGLPKDLRTAELRLFAPNVARELRKLPPGSVVLGDPRSRNPYMAMAVAPVYVVSSVPRHTALTPENRVDERFSTAVSFFDGDLTSGRSLDERIALLRRERVDAILVHPFASAPIRTALDELPGVTLVARGTNQQLYLVDRSQLPGRTAAESAGSSNSGE